MAILCALFALKDGIIELLHVEKVIGNRPGEHLVSSDPEQPLTFNKDNLTCGFEAG